MQNGDLNWILPGKLLAFAGPTGVAKVLWGYRTFTPEDYWGYFRDTGMTDVVRLNNKVRQRCCFYQLCMKQRAELGWLHWAEASQCGGWDDRHFTAY